MMCCVEDDSEVKEMQRQELAGEVEQPPSVPSGRWK